MVDPDMVELFTRKLLHELREEMVDTVKVDATISIFTDRVDPVNVENVALPIISVDTFIDDTCTAFVGTNNPPVDVVST